jgi:DNA-directed RNA polymerase specialized sigma24 family protein
MPRRSFVHLFSSAGPVGDQVPDRELLRRFAHERDAAAFELLVRRHADAVWTACRGVLRCEADAEDAFQATFVVLARRAGTVRGPSAGAWLYRVARNAALKLRERAARVATAPAGRLGSVLQIR